MGKDMKKATDGSVVPDGVGLGKGAWDCNLMRAIPPEDEARIFEEIPTMEYAFEGIPTIPPKLDLRHMAFYCNGTRFRLECYPDWTIQKVKQGLFAGGIKRANRPGGNTRGINGWKDLDIIFAGQVLLNGKTLESYNVPPGCGCLIAIETEKLNIQTPDPDSAYWN